MWHHVGDSSAIMLDALANHADSPTDVDAVRRMLREHMGLYDKLETAHLSRADASPPPFEPAWAAVRSVRLCQHVQLQLSTTRVMGKLVWPASLAVAEMLVDGTLAEMLGLEQGKEQVTARSEWRPGGTLVAVSYTHLTLPTNRIV
mgnify:FL=1